MTLYDMSTQDEGEGGIVMNIFRPEGEMPAMEAGDIVIVYNVKTQSFNSSTTSLLTSFRTDIHVYDGERISTCKSARLAPLALREPSRKFSRKPDAKEHEYVLSLYQQIDKTIIPDDSTVQAGQSLNLREKFSALKDVKEGRFADLIVEVVKQPFDLGDKMSLWVSDYTEHSAFFQKSVDNPDTLGDRSSRDGDPYGYTAKYNKIQDFPTDGAHQWLGPSGKKSMQVTCWEPHAGFIRCHVNAGDWVRLRNVQIGWGREGANIEGFLRGDLKYPDRIYVDILDPAADRETINPNLKDAIRRKRDYDKEHGQQAKGKGKRSAPDEPAKETVLSRRQKSRVKKQKEYQEKETKAEEQLGLNKLIVCENRSQSIVPLSTILEPVRYRTTINNEPAILDLPFTNAKFHTQVRVVDFHPASLHDFAVSQERKKYPCLSDDGNGSNDDTSSSSSSSEADPERPGLLWTWRFALKVEEVSTSTSKTKKKPATAWVLVDNQDAQLLTGLDAANLHSADNKDILGNLREQMFTLWGNLEECKSRDEAARKKLAKKPLAAPPVDSDAEEDTAANDADSGGVNDVAPPSSQLTNKPFRCCLRQYGIRVEAEKGEEDNAGEGYRWERMFGMFATKIRSD